MDKNKKKYNTSIYSKILINRDVSIPIVNIGNNIKQTLEKKVSFEIEGKCIVEGYIKKNSVQIISYSNGLINSSNIKFCVVIECLVCSPVEGAHIHCVAKNITKAGNRAETNEDISPVVIFIARDHHHSSKYFSNIKEDDKMKIRVIGQRFELNDEFISIIGELLEPYKGKEKEKGKVKEKGKEKEKEK